MNLQTWITTYFNRIPRGKKTSWSSRNCLARNKRVRLDCELLEARVVPALGNPLTTLVDPNNSSGDYFGSAVSVSGNNVLVGVSGFNGSAGAAYLYSTSGQLLRSFQDPNNASGDFFGTSVALSGSNVLVGASGVNGYAGAAYLYSTTGQLIQTIQDPSNAPYDRFGYSVALSGNNALVGAPGCFDGEGAAYLYSITSGQMTGFFQDPNSTFGDTFGYSVALSGSHLVVGTPGVNNAAGAAYLYSTSGQLLQTIQDPNNNSFDNFGGAVALSGSNVLVGAYGVNNEVGSAYLYSTSGQLLLTLQDPKNSSYDHFGTSVALLGSNVLVGAYGVDNDAGAAYLYSTSGPLLLTFQDPNSTNGDALGSSVALSGSNVLVGATGYYDDEGAAYVYGVPSSLSAFVGNNESTVVGTVFGTTLEVQVSDGFGNPVSGASVTFSETNGTGGAGATFTGDTTVYTNSAGLAIAPVLTANSVAGTYTITATLGSLSTTFLMHNISGAPASISAIGGTPQSTQVGSAYGILLQAQVLDSDGNPVANAPVTFTVPVFGEPDGTFNALPTVLTNALGIATAPTLTDNLPFIMPLAFTVTATVAGVADPADFYLSMSLDIISVLGGTSQNTLIGSAFSTLLQAQVLDSNNKPVANVPVTFVVPTFGATGTFNASTTVLTNAQGIATAPALTANHEPGTFTVMATAADVADPADFTLTNTTIPAAVKVEAGSGQHSTVNTAFVTPLQVVVTDSSGKPVSGITVDFEVPGSGASGTFASVGVVTNASGVATAPALTANTMAGTWTVDAWVAGVATPAALMLTNAAGATYSVKAHGGNNQSATVGKSFATPLQALVVDAYGNPIIGASVTFSFTATPEAPGGTFPGGKTSVVVTTGANGVAKAPTFTANTFAGNFLVQASAGGFAETDFSLTNNALPPHDPVGGPAQSAGVGQVYGQPLQARVSDIFGNPISGVTVTFTAPAKGASGSFAGQRTASAVTGPDGVAIAPPFTANTKAGRFLVTVSARGVPPGYIALTNLPGPVAVVKPVGGTARTMTVNGTLGALEVLVTDAFGNVIQGVTVTFAVQSDAGSDASATFADGATATVTTNSLGEAKAPPLKANEHPGTISVTATVDGGEEMVSFEVTIR